MVTYAYVKKGETIQEARRRIAKQMKKPEQKMKATPSARKKIKIKRPGIETQKQSKTFFFGNKQKRNTRGVFKGYK